MTLTDTDRATAWQAQSLVLTYPDERLAQRMPMLRAATRTLPQAPARPLARFLDHAAATPLLELAADYVATFDHRKRFSPYLTYFTYGDTRKRGMALLRFKHAYRTAGLELDEDELPDHLAVVLEFAATGDAAAGRRLLVEHRAGLELMRLGLRETGSPWAHVLESVSATLPPLGGREHEAVARLAAEGPPEEEVGLDPFAPPEYMPPAGGPR
ncbi:nitrate reductase molybdenum cofactor assembly chaperone [Saccharomonospora iraqiensis]|uniref:nitrate reductase molybdenum cofactor assembly chaperone n=1 Tax=Saccharomonospora iraqiensis TaxID=52698 RepID=UPI000408418D|nr:nitrate reductase molybdenum cofactor assembly chaperone [Saccharomonospora iraqiensis]